MSANGIQTSEEMRQLLYTDFDGNPSDPDEVILEALDDERFKERVPALTQILLNPAAFPYDRFLACSALASWGEMAGFLGVIKVAENPEKNPWIGLSIDRFFSVDDTYGYLAESVDIGEHYAPRNGAESMRWEALEALIDIADQHYFDRKLEWTLGVMQSDQTMAATRKVVNRGIDALANGFRPSFDLPTQLAGLLAAIAKTDEENVAPIAEKFLEIEPHYRALRELILIVWRGKGEPSLRLAQRLENVLTESPELLDELHQALASRKESHEHN